MKSRCRTVAVGVLACCCAACGASRPNPIASEPEPAYKVDFAKRCPGCKFRNYKDRIAFGFDTRDGEPALIVATPGTNKVNVAWGLETPRFSVVPGQEFVARLEMSGALPISRYVIPGASVVWYGMDGAPLMTVDTLGDDKPISTPLDFPLRMGGEGASTACTKSLVPAGAASAAVSIMVDHPDVLPGTEVAVRKIEFFAHPAGAHWVFDDLDAPELEVMTPSPCTDVCAPIRFRLRDASGVDVGSVRCRIDGRDVTERLSADSANGECAYVYAPDSPWSLGSVHSIEVDCADALGNAATDYGFVAFASDRVRHSSWTVRDDGVVLRDGAPFFPVGIGDVQAAKPNGNDLDRAAQDLMAAGFNLAHTYMVRGRKNHPQSVHYDELLSACERRGLLMMAEPSMRQGDRDDRDRLAMSNALYGRGCVEMFAWGIGDDTSRLQSPADLKRLHRLCKACDPSLLTVSIDAVASSVQQAPYVPYADVLILEQYPLRWELPQDDEMAKMALIIDNAWEAVRLSGAANRSVMSMPQTFSGFRRWARFPTEEELRAMTFIPIACRARGVVYYTYFSRSGNPSAFSTSENRAIVVKVALEVSALQSSLAKRDALRQPELVVVAGPKANALGGPSVRCLLKEDGLLVAANTSHAAVTAELRCSGGVIIRHEFPRYGVLVDRVPIGK